MKIKIKILFPSNWFAIHSIKIYIDEIYFGKIIAKGESTIEIPEGTSKIRFKLSYFYKSSIDISSFEPDQIIVLFLNRHNFISTLINSLRKGYLKSSLVNEVNSREFEKKILYSDNTFIKPKDHKLSVISIILSLIIVILSVVDNTSELNDIFFLYGLILLISHIVYFNEKEVLLSFFKARYIGTILLFVLSTFFMSSEYNVFKYTILIFSSLLYLLYTKNVKDEKSISYKYLDEIY